MLLVMFRQTNRAIRCVTSLQLELHSRDSGDRRNRTDLFVSLQFGKITQYSNVLILFIFFVCYTFATITQCFLISVFFKRANLAACGNDPSYSTPTRERLSSVLGAGIIYFILYLPYTALLNYDSQTVTWHKVIAVSDAFRKTCERASLGACVVFLVDCGIWTGL